MKPKPITEAQFFALLEKALSKVIPDLNLRAAIHDEVTKEVRLHNHLATFTKFCEEGSVPDLKPETVAELQDQLTAGFGSDAKVELKPDAEGGNGVAVEITLPDRTISSQIKVAAAGAGDDDGQPKAPFVPFPVALPTDAELVWVLARREDLGPDEAARALSHIQEEFWGSKSGQKLMREGEERNFAAFIAAVPAAALLEAGLKRHYKAPETLHSLHMTGGARPESESPKADAGEPIFRDKPVAAPERKPVQEEATVASGKHPLSDGAGEDDAPPWD